MINDKEKHILKVFSDLMEEIGGSELYKIGNLSCKDGKYTLYKDEDYWVSFCDSKDGICNVVAYRNLYDLCIDLLETLAKEKSASVIKKFALILNCYMPDSKSKIIDLINSELYIEFFSTPIVRLREQQFVSGMLRTISKFDYYSIKQFLILYKIDQLLKLGIINEYVANLLRELFNVQRKLKARINARVGTQMHSGNMDFSDLVEMSKKDNEINKIFKKYNLSFDDIDIEEIMLDHIQKENYNAQDGEELKALVHETKKYCL